MGLPAGRQVSNKVPAIAAGISHFFRKKELKRSNSMFKHYYICSAYCNPVIKANVTIAECRKQNEHNH